MDPITIALEQLVQGSLVSLLRSAHEVSGLA